MANNQPNNEQWKTDGNCSICRRKPYCKKACSAHKKSLQREIGRDFASTRLGSVILAVNAVTRCDYGKGGAKN